LPSILLRPPARGGEHDEDNGGKKNTGEIEEPVMSGQLSRDQVEYVDGGMEDVEGGRG
jgi:hypothetical protein